MRAIAAVALLASVASASPTGRVVGKVAITDRTVDVYILRLRQKIEADPANPLMIRSVRGFGYSFNNSAQPAELEPRETAFAS